MAKKERRTSIIVYQANSGALELRGDVSKETVWATQAQIAEIFDVERSVVTKHIRNIFASNELDEKSNVQKMHIASSDKPVAFYNLDVILSLGYRTNSGRATEFRKWATKTLRGYIVDGFAIDKRRVAKQYDQFMEAVESVKRLLPSGSAADTQSILELISLFADTWLSLDAYDKDSMSAKGSTKSHVKLTADALTKALLALKTHLLEKDEATGLFGQERNTGSVAGIVGNVMQSFGDKEVYPTVEEKAAHLLYFIVKNHPFSDGNKRSGAYAFVWFLRRAKRLDTKRITPVALTALTLLVAESNPKDREQMVRLVITLIQGFKKK